MKEGEVKIKWVKKAGLWCKTWFERDNKGVLHQKQEWCVEKPDPKIDSPS